MRAKKRERLNALIRMSYSAQMGKCKRTIENTEAKAKGGGSGECPKVCAGEYAGELVYDNVTNIFKRSGILNRAKYAYNPSFESDASDDEAKINSHHGKQGR